MIKCDYFGKLLKPLFSILLIGFFGLSVNSFVNGAGAIQPVGLDKYGSDLNNQFKLGFLKGGGLITDYLGQGKSILALDNDKFFWWATNGQPYFYSPYFQGFFSEYFACSVITYSGDFLNSCDSGTPITGDFKSLFQGFFGKVKNGDLAFYRFDYEHGGVNCSYRKENITVCFSSDEIGSSLCFSSTPNCHYGCQGGHGYCNGYFGGGLINSQELSDLSFGLISNSWIGYAPGQNGYNGEYEGNTEGSNQGIVDSTYTGDYTYTECTNGAIMNYAEKMGISPYMCQGGIDNWDLLIATGIYNPIPGSGKWLDEIFGHTSTSGQLNAKEWFDYWNTSYVNQYVSNQNIWYSQPAVLRFYFKFYNEYGGNNFDFDTVYEYCLMRKFYTWDNQYATHKYQGQYFKKTCSFINNGGWDGPGSSDNGGNPGEDIIGMNWNGVGGLSGGKTYSDPGVFITDMFTKIKSYIPTDKSDIGLGFLPQFIITFMLFLMLFRFLSH